MGGCRPTGQRLTGNWCRDSVRRRDRKLRSKVDVAGKMDQVFIGETLHPKQWAAWQDYIRPPDESDPEYQARRVQAAPEKGYRSTAWHL
jgi:hypothetical protein